MQKYFISHIIAEYGIFKHLPQESMYEEIKISFDFLEDKSGSKIGIKAIFDFDDFYGSQEEARQKSGWLTKNIALQLALKNGLHFSYKSNVSSGWKEKDEEKWTQSVSYGVDALTTRGIDIIQIGLNPQNDDLLNILELFNKSLFHFEHNREREGVFWLYLVWEALKLILTRGKESKLKEKLIKAKVISEEECKKFKYSIGAYYRHYRHEKKTLQPHLIIKGTKCKNIMQKILLHFTKS